MEEDDKLPGFIIALFFIAAPFAFFLFMVLLYFVMNLLKLPWFFSLLMLYWLIAAILAAYRLVVTRKIFYGIAMLCPFILPFTSARAKQKQIEELRSRYDDSAAADKHQDTPKRGTDIEDNLSISPIAMLLGVAMVLLLIFVLLNWKNAF